jgi:hypothetical protein
MRMTTPNRSDTRRLPDESVLARRVRTILIGSQQIGTNNAILGTVRTRAGLRVSVSSIPALHVGLRWLATQAQRLQDYILVANLVTVLLAQTRTKLELAPLTVGHSNSGES